MQIGGLQKFSLIDYPDKVSCVVFTQGCNFRCPYCYNPELVVPQRYGTIINEKEVREFLQDRRRFLDAVVISGGEPTLQPDLISFVQEIKQSGYLVKLNTNGSQPHVLRRLIYLKALDFIAMDIKSPLENYPFVAGSSIPPQNIQKSIEIITESEIPYDFRITVTKSLCSEEDLSNIRILLKKSSSFKLQKAVLDTKIIDSSLLDMPQYSDSEFARLKNIYEINKSENKA